METLAIDDLIVMGRSWPEPLRDGRYTVCTAGYSPSHGFIRLYPTTVKSPLKNWNIVKVAVERNSLDTRSESWKIVGSKSEWGILDKKIKVVGSLDRKDSISLIRKLAKDSIEDLNNKKRSLGVVKPKLFGWELKERPGDHSVQTTLRGFKLKSKKDFPYKPYIRYSCLPKCTSKSPHNQQLIEWGAYMWFNKHKDRSSVEKVFENLRLGDPEYEKHLFVGNLLHHRRTFAIISVLRFKIKQ